MRPKRQQVGPIGPCRPGQESGFYSERKTLVGLKPINDIIKHVLKTLLWLLENSLWGWGKKRQNHSGGYWVDLLRGDGDLDQGGEIEVVRSSQILYFEGTD